MTPAPRINATLRRIVWPADFRRNEVSLLAALPRGWLGSLRGNDCIVFVSGTGNQVLFVWRPVVVGTIAGTTRYAEHERIAYVSSRLRLNVGTFNPEMLANYAAAVGLNFDGIERFEERYRRLLNGGE